MLQFSRSTDVVEKKKLKTQWSSAYRLYPPPARTMLRLALRPPPYNLRTTPEPARVLSSFFQNIALFRLSHISSPSLRRPAPVKDAVWNKMFKVRTALTAHLPVLCGAPRALSLPLASSTLTVPWAYHALPYAVSGNTLPAHLPRLVNSECACMWGAGARARHLCRRRRRLQAQCPAH